MIDIKLLRADPELVKENIRKKFQDEKLVLVDEVVEMDAECAQRIPGCDALRNQRNVISKQIGGMMARGERDKAEETKKQVVAMAGRNGSSSRCARQNLRRRSTSA